VVEKLKGRIGTQVQRLRRQQHRTLDELAKMCGYSKSLLSKIENGNTLPSVGALVRIAGALGTSVSALIETAGDSHAVFTSRAKSVQSMIETPQGLLIHPFGTEHANKRMQPFLQVSHKEKLKPRVDSHDGEEFIYILNGSLRFRISDVDYILNKGDSLYFDSLEKHQGTPLSDTVEYLDVFV
jgi:transcriptional regulator with XRE-family HTH domain